MTCIDTKPTNSFLGNINISRMTIADRELTIDWITRQYNFDRAEVTWWVDNLHFNWPLSVKAMDEKGNTVGLLNMSDYRIDEETPLIAKQLPELLNRLNSLRYTAVFSFIVAEPFRHTPLNHQMIMSIWEELKVNYDFLFVPVMHRLKTHDYWKRRGAIEFFRDEESVYYLIKINGDIDL